MTDDQHIRVAIAALAMQAVIPQHAPIAQYSAKIAALAVAHADALILELQKPRLTV
jgi:hypothetical protein